MHQPLYLTDEEIEELNNLLNEGSTEAWEMSGNRWRDSDWYYDYDDDWSHSSRKRHEWVAVLLLSQTVYDCKHCGVHKDKAKGDYCDEER